MKKFNKVIVIGLILSILSSCSSPLFNTKTEEPTYEDVVKNMSSPRKLKKLKTPIGLDNSILLHTYSQITLYDYGDEQLIYECFALIDHYEDLLSTGLDKKQTSEIHKINEAQGQPVSVSDETLECINYGYEYSKASLDTFDITIGALTNIWPFKDTDVEKVAPSEEAIKSALATVGYENVKITGNEVQLLNKDTKLELGAIAKGFIADKVCEYLKSQGVNSAIINLGGNVYALGYKDEETKTPFKVGLRKPISDKIEEAGYVVANDLSIVSSGGYEQYFTDKTTGITYTHILDKNTGYPVETDIAQATVLSKKSVDGDALSTTVYSLGSVEGLKLIESLEDIECIIMKKDGTTLLSSGVSDSDDTKIKYVQQQ